MFFQLLSTIKEKSVDKMMQSAYLCVILYVEHKKNISWGFNLIFNTCWGKFFFVLFFRFLAYLLSCIPLLFALRYFVNYAPLLRAVCKFRYSLLSRPHLLLVFYVSISVASFVEVDYLFPRWP